MRSQVQTESDPFLTILDRNIQLAIEARSTYIANRERQEREYERLNELARGSVRRSALTVEGVAERFGAKPGTVREGVGKFSCLRKGAYKPGQRLLFPLHVVELHERNLISTGECGNCFEKKAAIELVKPKRV
jgi:hypothetical protein